ncbi:MAG TPA: DUF3037 domain-containing protein [Jatrophihabitantaceae bacterium]
MTTTRHPFEYVVLRVVPRVDRGESINAGVVVYCRALDYLGCRVQLDRDRLAALDASADADDIDRALTAVTDGCHDAEEIGPWFRWLTAPRSTVVQPGPVHTGLTADPAGELDRLLALLVLPR